MSEDAHSQNIARILYSRPSSLSSNECHQICEEFLLTHKKREKRLQLNKSNDGDVLLSEMGRCSGSLASPCALSCEW